MTRRKFIPLAGLAAGAGYLSLRGQHTAEYVSGPPGKSAVAILKAQSYSEELVTTMMEGARNCGLNARGKRVLLKPNLVEFDVSTVINTDAAVLAAALELFQRLGAAEVRIGEGPGHRRDTYDLAAEANYRSSIARFDELFVDLNRDDVTAVRGFANESEFFFPNAALGADLIVSLAKMKTHHWAGVTLSMKNLFGLVPGSVYGWPKNKLHYIGIPESIIAINRQFPRTFAIVDGIVGMEGNGPIQGTPKAGGVLVMGSDLVAVDATCCRIMGINPGHVEYLRMAAATGHLGIDRIEQRGELITSVQGNWQRPPGFTG
ncbi:MAG: DUF362 domain-containing protein [Acidobacteriota bacterium]|nr:DUF362 domain-containing protein [Acidobacteriota bacterium]